MAEEDKCHQLAIRDAGAHLKVDEHGADTLRSRLMCKDTEPVLVLKLEGRRRDLNKRTRCYRSMQKRMSPFEIARLVYLKI